MVLAESSLPAIPRCGSEVILDPPDQPISPLNTLWAVLISSTKSTNPGWSLPIFLTHKSVRYGGCFKPLGLGVFFFYTRTDTWTFSIKKKNTKRTVHTLIWKHSPSLQLKSGSSCVLESHLNQQDQTQSSSWHFMLRKCLLISQHILLTWFQALLPINKIRVL